MGRDTSGPFGVAIPGALLVVLSCFWRKLGGSVDFILKRRSTYYAEYLECGLSIALPSQN